jgi:hypothetical protein
MSFDTTGYQRSRVRWTQDVWYGRQRDLLDAIDARARGRDMEDIAARSVLPKLGFSNVVHLADILFNSPFDFVADRGSQRVSIDITTKWQKRVDAKAPLSHALGLPLFVVMISPRAPQFFHCVEVRLEAKSVRVPFDLLRRMSTEIARIPNGR